VGQKVGGARSCNFPTDSCKFWTEEIIGAQNFNFAPEFPKMGVFIPKLAFWDENFWTNKIFKLPKI